VPAGHVGIQVAATTPPAELAGIVTEAERLGYAEIWLAEDYFELGGMASVASALAATQEVPIGLGVVSARVRHPAVTAMELATVSAVHPGRFLAGLGHGVPSWMEQMGLRPKSLIRSMREATKGIRRLLDGEELTEEGEYYTFDGIRLLHPPAEHVPLYFGVHGPRSLQLSGELADGTLLGWFSSPDYVRWARQRIDEGRARAGRTDRHAVVVLCILSISDGDPGGTRAELAEWATDHLVAQAGLPETLAPRAGREFDAAPQARVDGGELLSDSVIGEFMAAGSTADCGRYIERLLAAGADRVVLVPNPAGQRSTDAMRDQIHAAASLVG
jgi:alkanesulfonate monooxygenase SsuD/methylene tetrahydromethanopterin reductase-like flavin-dependent oxidoreductase (luciferase family)